MDIVAIETDALTNARAGSGEEPEHGVVRLPTKGRFQAERGTENLRDISR
jgi:hypothetical protein